MKSLLLIGVVGSLSAVLNVGHCGDLTVVAPDDPNIGYAGYVRKAIITAADEPASKRIRFDRILEMPATGYRWDNPGVTIRFRTDATTIHALLNYNEMHLSKTARNGVGVWSVDGLFHPEQSFQPQTQTVQRPTETLVVDLSLKNAIGFHDYEIFLPYGDSVDFSGLEVNRGARFEPVTRKVGRRYVAYGDSITQGFSASSVDKTYPFLVSEYNGWETVNLGFGGRSSFPAPSDAEVLASLKPDIVTVLLGVNDWLGNVPPESYRANMRTFLSKFRSLLPQTPVYMLTPLWVSPSWNRPSPQENTLETYREILRNLVVASNDPNLHLIEGPDLIDADPLLFDRVAVHPNDKGFSMMAERLAKKLRDSQKNP